MTINKDIRVPGLPMEFWNSQIQMLFIRTTRFRISHLRQAQNKKHYGTKLGPSFQNGFSVLQITTVYLHCFGFIPIITRSQRIISHAIFMLSTQLLGSMV
jgi:hypothetical protein